MCVHFGSAASDTGLDTEKVLRQVRRMNKKLKNL